MQKEMENMYLWRAPVVQERPDPWWVGVEDWLSREEGLGRQSREGVSGQESQVE
jgi:hypothetical protein